MQKPLCVSVECQHLSKAVRVTIARLEGLTAGMLKASLNVKEKGALPAGYLSLVMAAQVDGDPPIIVEDDEDLTELLPLAIQIFYTLGKTKRQAEQYRADVFQNARALRDQGLLLVRLDDDPEIEERVQQHRFRSVLRVKKDRARSRKSRTALEGVKAAPPRIK